MSTKDLLDRLQKSSGPTVTRRRAEGDRPEEGVQTSTRVASGVIRRRRKVRPGAPAAGDLPKVGAPKTTTAHRRVLESPPGAAAAEAPPPVAGAPAPPVEVEAAPTPEPEAPPVVEASAPEPESKPESKPEPVAETGPEADPAPAEIRAEAAPEPPAEPAAPPAPPAPPAPIPRSEGRGETPRMPELPGLGAAVVKPPPGWDPTNPRASMARARQTGKPAGGAPSGGPSRPGSPGNAPASAGEKRTGRGEPDRKDTRGRGRPNQRRRRGRVEAFMDEMPMRRRKRTRRSAGPKTPSPKPKAEKRKIRIDNTISVGQLAHELGVKSKEVIKSLMSAGTMATINEQLDVETASLVAQEFEYEVVNVGFEEENILIADEAVADAERTVRPPVVTIMGHVDHGKTSLLDKIRSSRVAAGEAGGITQHIGAYQVKREGELITFIDTPGHEAFTAMRSRGASVTDIVVLVVAADDGVMPQTIESINHAKAADVPIIVAVNKCDKPGVSPDQVRQALMQYELVPEEYGGETLMNNVSAMTGDGIDELLESIQLVAEMTEISAAVDRHAVGVVLEARLEQGRGAVASILVKDGTLSKGDPLVLGTQWGKVRAMMDHKGKVIKKAGPSTPVEVIGLDGVPNAGDDFVVVKSDKDARTLAQHRLEQERKRNISSRGRVSLQDLFARAQEGAVKSLNLIIKGDVIGSVEAVRSSFENLQIEGTEVKVLHAAVGKVTESDVSLASVNGAIIIGFNVRPDAKARKLAASDEVEVRTYKVIYEALDDVKNALLGLLEPDYEERHQGAAEVRKVFVIPKIGAICGCMVVDGKVGRNNKARLTRDGVVIWEGKIGSLKRFKDDAKEVQQGYECGIGLEGYNDIKEGDEIETYTVEAVARTG